MAINYSVLKAELVTDPQTYGYAVALAAGEPETAAALMNKIRDGSDGEAAITVNRGAILPMELMEAIDIRDLNIGGQLNATLVGAWLDALLQSAASIRLRNTDGTKTRTRDNIDRVLGATQGSQARFDALAQRFGSRGEQLFGEGTEISTQDIANARTS